MCVKRMSSRSCLGRFSQFAIPTLMCNVFSVTCFCHFFWGGGGNLFIMMV